MRKLFTGLLIVAAALFTMNATFACDCGCDKKDCNCICHQKCDENCTCGCHKGEKCTCKDCKCKCHQKCDEKCACACHKDKCNCLNDGKCTCGKDCKCKKQDKKIQCDCNK